MKAKEYFEGIRAEVVKTDKARDMLERMKAKEGAKTQSYTGGLSRGFTCGFVSAFSRSLCVVLRL